MWDRQQFEREYAFQFDEINKLVDAEFENGPDAVAELVESFLILAYQKGKERTDDMLDFYDFNDDLDDLEAALSVTYDGVGFKEKVIEYANNGDLNGIKKVLDTQYHRMFEEGGHNEALRLNAINPIDKGWNTMLDNVVRDPHSYLEGIKVGLNDKFVTYTGDEARWPGDFNVPELDINCRCYLTYSWSGKT